MSVVDEAGAVVVGVRSGVPSVLLVTAKRNPAHWIFPKGHVEPGESFAVAAVREAEEEAGVAGTVLQEAGTLSFSEPGATYRVHYYVVATRDEGQPERGRRLKWCPFDEALGQLTFQDSRQMLQDVWPAIEPQLVSFFSARNE